MAEKRVQRRLAAILAADVVGYSRLISEWEFGISRVRQVQNAVCLEFPFADQGTIVIHQHLMA